MNLVEKISKAINSDGWVNVLTSIGVKGKDKRLSATITWKRGVREDFENLYAADDVAANVVDVVPEDALSKGYKIIGFANPDSQKYVQDRLKVLKFDSKILEGGKLARLHGGAAIVKITEDGQLELPAAKNKKIISLSVVDRWDLDIQGTDIDGDITSTTYREPIYYQLNSSDGASTNFGKVHHTRIVKFDGVFLPKRIKEKNNYWGDSVLTRIENAIRNYNISHDAAATTIQDFDIPVLKMQNLAELMNADCDDKVIKRLEMVNLSKSIAKMIVLDADKEDFEHKSRNVTGMKDVLDKIESRLVTATRMPRTKLFGESAGGLGSTGESQQSDWYDYIESYQANTLKDKMLDIIRHIVATELPSEDPAKIDIEFNPLWQMSAQEETTLRKTQADLDAIYINAGVLDPIEVAMSRFGGDKYSQETMIDKELRKEVSLTEPLPEEVLPPELPEEEEEEAPPKQQAVIEDKKPQPNFRIKRGDRFEHQFVLKAKDGALLNLDGYEFSGMLDLGGEKLGIQVNKTDELGQVSCVIPIKTSEMICDTGDSVLGKVEIMMKNPAGTQKVIKSFLVEVNG